MESKYFIGKNVKVHEDGDANCYTILDEPNHWLASIRINGDKTVAQQRIIINLFAAAIKDQK